MKRKTSVLFLIIALLATGIFVSCSSSSSGDEVKYSDQDFLKSLSKGLEKRWELNDQHANEETTLQHMKDYIQAELDQVEQYQSATFEDSVLQEKALKYINVLKASMENVEYYFSSSDSDKWTDIYNERTILIKDFVDNYGLTVSEKYQKTLDELAANGKTAGIQASQKEAIQKLIDKLEFKVTREDYGWKTYEAILENTTDFKIKDLSLEISLLDADGVIVSTQYVNADNVGTGQKARLQFETDENFDKYEVVMSWFEAE